MNSKNSSQFITLAVLGAGYFFQWNAQAYIGSIGFESTSFLYKSTERGTSSTTLKAGLEGKGQQRYFHEEADLTAYSYVGDNPVFNAESQQMYIATQKGVVGDGELTIGRRVYEWSKVDSQWSMMSLWSPHYTWDPLYPQTIGMTGAFYNFEGDHIKVLAYASPIAIPERGAPIEEHDGMITSPNPFWKPLPGSTNILGVPTDIHYTLVMPPMQEILMRPNAALKVKYEEGGGYWASGSVGILPVHTTQLAAETGLDLPSPGTRAQVDIHPQFPMRNIYTVETGWEAEKNEWDVWASGSYEQPYNFKNDPSWINPVITPATIVSSGTDIKLTSNFTFHGGVLYVHEQPYQRSGSSPSVSIELPSRFPVKQGVQVGGDLRHSDYTRSNMRWIQDLVNRSHFFSLDLSHQFKKSDVSVGVGGDIIYAQSEKGWVGQYYGDDRVRGWLKYAF